MLLLSFARGEAAPPGASPCTLAWNSSTDPLVCGYAVYYGAKGSGTTNRLDAGCTNQVTFKNLFANTNYFFYVVSYAGSGIESPPSITMGYTPNALSALKLIPSTNGTMNLHCLAATGAVCYVEYTPTLQPAQWQILGSATADSNGNIMLTDQLSKNIPSRFYRAFLYSNPQVPSALAITGSTPGTITIHFHVAPGSVCHVEFTPSLRPPQWQTLASATADTNGNVTVTDPLTGKPATRFYRAATP